MSNVTFFDQNFNIKIYRVKYVRLQQQYNFLNCGKTKKQIITHTLNIVVFV